MDNAMKSHFHEMHEPQHALTTLADGLPALGIVAAVLASSRPWDRSTSRRACWAG